MRRLGVAVVLVAACGGAPASTSTTDPRFAAAFEYAVSADRALEGTRFSGLAPSAVADLIVALCAGEGAVVSGVDSALAGIEAPPGDAAGDAILREVLLTAIGQVCPERVAADLTAAYLAAVHSTVVSEGGVGIDDSTAVPIGLAACEALDAGTPEDALVTVAAGGFGIEASLEEILAGALDPAHGITAGAVLAAAATYLCPEHQERVEEFIAGLAE